jgi:arsenical pump membrane protein
VGPGAAAAFGVGVMLVTQIVSPADLLRSFHDLWRPFLTILSIMLTTNVAQRLGLLDFFADVLKARRDRDTARAFRSVFILSAITSVVLNNDAAVLLLTPIVVGFIRGHYPNRPDLIIPFAFAVFSAAGVAPLVISNPMNLIVAEYAGIGFNQYAVRMIPISVVGWITAYVILHLFFRRQLHVEELSEGRDERRPKLSLPGKQFIWLLVTALLCYPLLSYVGGPVWAVAAAGAALGVWLCRHYRVASPAKLAATLAWEILIFLFCVFVLVLGLRNVGFVSQITAYYNSSSDSSLQIALVAGSSAIGSAVLNNHPMAILNTLAIRELPHPTLDHVLAALIGGDLGPRLLPTGSLAGLLWLATLRDQGVHISLALFMRIGVAVTIPTLTLSVMILLWM